MGTRQRVRREDRPTVTRAAVDAAIAAITDRHLSVEAPYAEELSDDPTQMYAHLRKRSIDFSGDLRRRDYRDVIVITRWITETEARRVELWALEQGKQLGLTNRQVGEPFGLISRQGVPDRIRTLRHLVHGASADAEGGGRPATGSAGRSPAGPPATAAERELEWLAANRRRILGLAGELLAYEALGDEDAVDWLTEVRRDVHDSACTPASFVVLGCAVDDLALSPDVRSLENGHALLTLIQEWRSLTAEHRNVTRERPAPGHGNA